MAEQNEHHLEPLMANLERSLGLVECTLMGVGVMLGAGIYALVGQASLMAGNAVWCSFVLASAVASLTGLSYAELSSFIPKAGGQYYYVRRAFGRLPAFLTTWLLLLGISVCSATVAIGFAGYLGAMLPTHELLTACLLVAAAAALLVVGIKESAWIAGLCTVVELAGLVIILYVGSSRLGTIDYFELGATGLGGVLSGAALIFFAYIGFEEIVQMSEETRNAVRTIPRAVLLSIMVTTVLYVAVSLCAISVVGWEQLGESKSPLADVAAVALGHRAFLLLAVVALFSTANTVLIMLMSAARLLYGMAEDGSLPQVFARVHRTRHSPWVATVAVAGLAVTAIVGLQNIVAVASLTNFALLLTFVIVNAAVIVLRFREPDAPRPFKIPGQIGHVPIVPAAGLMTSLGLLPFVGWKATMAGLVLLAIGIVIYVIAGLNRPHLR